MTNLRCSCGARARDGYLCKACRRQLREALTELAPAGPGTSTRWDLPRAAEVGGLADHLAVALARQARIGDSDTRGGEKPVPFHEKAGEVRALLVGALGPWARFVLEMERPAARRRPCPHRDRVGADCRSCAVDGEMLHRVRVAKWRRARAAVDLGDAGVLAAVLLERLPAIVSRPEAPALLAGVLAGVHRAQEVIDRPAEVVAAGECGAELPDETVCQRALYVDPEADFVDCPACGTRWAVAERRAWLLAAAQDSLGTAATIATALTRLDEPVTADRIYQWKRRGRLKPRGHEAPRPCRDHQGRGNQPTCKACAAKEGAPLYRLGDVVDLLVEAAQAQVARARKAAAS